MKKLLFVILILGALCPIGRWKLAASEKSFILRPLASEPTVQTSNIVVTNATTSNISFTVIAGNGTHQMIVMKKNDPVDVLPVDGVSYQGTYVFGTGSDLGSGNFVVGIGGPDWSWSIGGLEPGVLYYIRSFALNDPLANINLTSNEANYLTSTAELNPIFASTLNEPRTLDSLALVALFDSTGGVNWTSNTNWKTANPIDSWYGVNISNGRVNYLDLTDNHLTGRLPSAIGDLSALVNLKLGSNIITGTIPVSIGNLTALEELYIHGNQFTGSIPSSLGNLSNLRILYLQLNYLTGSIPHEIGNLSQVQLITVSGNDLSDSIPSEIGNLTNLTALYLNGNQFSGTIPTTLGNLTGLQYLTLSDNQLTGSIPTELGALTQLQWLWLASNHLSGSIPSQIGNLTHLTQLFLDHNTFVGDVPDLSGMTNLEELRLHANRFSGLPDFSSISSLTDLIVDHNMFTFEDIEPNIGVPSSTFTYSPQDSVGAYIDTTVEAGSIKEFTILVGGASNQYQWYKNGIIIGGATSAFYTIPSVTYLDSGTYHCRITNTVATALTLYSRTFKLHVGLIPPPIISSFSPTSGPIGTSVTITGNNFNATATNNTVYFGAVKAQVTNAASTELTVIVPTGTTYAPITVMDTTTGLTAYSSKPFVVTFPSSQVIDATSFASKVDFTTGAAPYTVAVGDLDGDGKPDVAVANQGSGMLSIFRNTSTIGSCNFAAKVDFATGVSPRGVAVGDLDGDGKPDVVVTNNGGTTISVYRNTSSIGAITLDPKVDFAMGNGPNTVAIGDVDGDGKADLVVASEFSNGMISIFQNTGNVGTISFAAKVDSVTGSGPWGVAIGDVDGDGKPDIVNANAGNNTISVFRNTSTGGSISLDPKVDFATGSYPLGVAVGDVDGDGKSDVVVTNYSGATVSVFRNTSNNGSISLALKADFATGSVPAGVALGDMDGDGKVDIAAANYGSSTVSVLRNTSTSGTIGLAAKVDFATGSSPVGVAVSDMDGDGKPDLAATNQGSSTVSVLRNTLPSGRILDSLALVALYDSTGGDNWTTKTNWKSSNLIDTWYGVTVTSGRVTQIILESNNLSGRLPAETGNLDSLKVLHLNWNQITGSLPLQIFDLKGLESFGMTSNQLTGVIPPEIGNLTSLGGLSFWGNQLSGSIPTELGTLTRLSSLVLRNNQLTGSIPTSFGNLTQMWEMYLDGNQLSGSIPSEIGNLINMTQLELHNNQLSGSIPFQIGNLTNLNYLDLSVNQLSGSIPAEIGNLTALTHVYLAQNKLTGDVPNLSTLTSLGDLRLSGNQFTGLPDLSSLTSLNQLFVENNKLTFEDIEPNIGGPNVSFIYSPQDSVGVYKDTTIETGAYMSFPLSVGGTNNFYMWYKNGSTIPNMSPVLIIPSVSLDDSGIYHCQITNTVATGLILYSRTYKLHVTPSARTLDSIALVALYDSTGGDNWTNKTNWKSTNPIDTWHGVTVNGGRVVSIQLGLNNLTGFIPSAICNLDSLDYLDVTNNQLTGIVPAQIWNMRSITNLYLARNKFSPWSIPASISNMTSLVNLYLSGDSLVGAIPAEIGNLTSLLYLSLNDNQLTGTFPTQIGNLTNLQLLYLQNNKLSGAIPAQIGNLTNVREIHLFDNQMTGTIPTQIGNLVGLQILFLNNNQLSGAIPSEIGGLTNLVRLDLSGNQLTGIVPGSLTSLLNLYRLDLSHNRFTELPDLTSFTNLNFLFVNDNRFTFEDIEPNIGAASQTFTYSPQDSVGNYSDVVTLPGVNLLLSVTVGGTHNQYQWMKDGIDIPGATGSEYNLLTSTGKYHCRITNTVATDLTLFSRSTTVTTYPLPAPPSNLTATPVSASRIILNWTASPDAVKYFVYRYPPGSSFALIDSVSAPATTYTDTGLTLVTTYNYHVLTMNQFRWLSVNSSDVSATTLGIAPTLGTPNVSNPSPIPSAAVTITVTATGTSPTVKLLYGKTTQTEGDSLTMTYNGINYSGTIPGSSVTQEGVWYRIRAQNTGGMVYYPATSRASISVTINDIATIWDNSHFYGGIPKEQYFTIAMSMDASLSLTGLWGAQILEDGIPTNWRAWEFDQPTQSFVDVTSLSGDKAYFIYHRQGSAQEIFNSATSRKTNDPQMFGNIVLSPQWNAVPWPYTFPANIFVKDLNQDSIGSVWKLWGVSGWEQVTEMRAFGGYMIYNKTGGNVRLGDVVDWTMMAVKPAVDQTEWRLRFIAESGEYRDAFNFAGVSANFTTLSEPEPVSVGKNIGLYFRRGDLTLSGDIRSANEDGHVWDMIVRNTTGKNRTRLTWDMMGALTSDVKVILVDVTNNQCIELDETVPYYEFRNQDQNRFKLVAGNAGYVLNEVNKIKAQLPDEFMLSQNYPNPFNPTTTIKFDVARSGHVRITVYNILGQSVVTLADGYFETGKGYRVTWNGKDVSGREVASGIYICRLESGKFSKVKKMLLVK